MNGHPLGFLYTGLAAELTALARLRRDGDLFYATDTGSLYVRVANAWVSAATSLPSLKVGGADDYLNIDSTGMLTLAGEAMVWDDIRIEPAARTTGTNAPTFEAWFTDGAGSRGVYLYSFDNAAAGSQKEVFFTLQTPHAWAGTAMHMHVHWIAESTAANSKVRWGLEYNMKEPLAAFGNTTIVYADTAEGSPAPTGTTQYRHEITEFAAITPGTTQDGFSTIMIARLFRASAAAEDTYTGKVGLLYIDVHLQLNKMGSNDEYV